MRKLWRTLAKRSQMPCGEILTSSSSAASMRTHLTHCADTHMRAHTCAYAHMHEHEHMCWTRTDAAAYACMCLYSMWTMHGFAQHGKAWQATALALALALALAQTCFASCMPARPPTCPPTRPTNVRECTRLGKGGDYTTYAAYKQRKSNMS